MISNHEFQSIADLDLDPIKVKLMHKESGEGWALEHANMIELEYRRFLYLMKMFPNAGAAPLVDVDIFWHYHILDTMKYAADCDSVFGYFLHHFPYLGMRGEDDEAALARAGVRMQDLYETTFGEPYPGATASGPRQEAAGAASQAPDNCYVETRQTLASPQQPAYCYFAGPGPGTRQQAAYCYHSSPVDAAAAHKPAYCYDGAGLAGTAETKHILASPQKPAYCYFAGPGPGTRQQPAYCYLPSPVEAAATQIAAGRELHPLDIALMKRGYDRPSLAVN